MSDYCNGGEFGGYVLTTRRDQQLCVEGGGKVVPNDTSSGGACSGRSIQTFSTARGDSIDAGPLYDVQTLYPESRELATMRRLSEEAAPLINKILQTDPDLSDQILEGFARLTSLAVGLRDRSDDEVIYRDDDHRYFVSLAHRIASLGGDDLRALVEGVVHLAEPYRNQPAAAVRDRLGPTPDYSELPVGEVQIMLPLGPVAPIIPDPPGKSPWAESSATTTLWEGPDRGWVGIATYRRELAAAESNIGSKGALLGTMASDPQGDVEPVDGGFVRHFRDCDIYYAPGIGAHEVHGEIRRKYLQLNGPSLLGLPTTDESSCPDLRGRYNHFSKNSSIYWTPTTGPFYVRGVVRFRWASSGWETGIGYPVADEQSLVGLYPPGDNPDVHWSSFERGIICGQGPAAENALAATASRDDIISALSAVLARRMPSTEVTVGLISATIRPGLYGVDFVGVDDWTYDFNQSGLRTLRLKVRGFVSVPIVSDPTFDIDLSLRFATTWPGGSFFFPATKTVIAVLAGPPTVHVSGVFSDTIAEMIKSAVVDAFTPGRAYPYVPKGAMVLATVATGANQRGAGNLDFLDVMLMADGSLNVYVNPLPDIVGAVRRLVAETALNNAIETL